MRFHILLMGLFALAADNAGPLFADDVPGLRQMDRHMPHSSSYVPLRPRHASRPFVGSRYTTSSHLYGYHHAHHHGDVLGSDCYSYPYFDSHTYGAWGLSPHGSYYYGLQPSTHVHSFYGPLVIPGNRVFGTGALFWGTTPAALLSRTMSNRVVARVPVVPAPAPLPGATLPANDAARPAVPLREANDQALARASKFMGFGDRLFARQQYHHAYQRYQDALKAAPTLAEAHFRRGFTLTGMKYYKRAAQAFAQGLALEPNWPQSEFALKELYDDNKVAEVALLETLAAAAQKNPTDADLLLLLAIHLYFGEQKDRSRLFFDRFVELSGMRELVSGFQKSLPPKKQPPVQVKPLGVEL